MITSVIFAAIHWYFGFRFIVTAFFMGLFYWWVVVNFGIIEAIITHSLVNILLLKSGIFKNYTIK
ncbi:CPBP family intramembrane metalloprotease [Candidatus Microgenomates bacterium]|nr:CPBP family intramembrane metalloprotease [Candidatus Microgenomates bacterium]